MALKLAPKCNVFEVPDLAFKLRPSSDEWLFAEVVIPSGVLAAILVPRVHLFDADGSRTARLVEKFSALANELIDRGLVESVLVVAQVTGPSIVEDDRLIANSIVELCARPEVSTFFDPVGPGSLMAIYGRAVGVVSVRLHGAVLALAVGSPAYAVSYFTGKTEGVLESVHRPGWCGAYDDIQVSEILDWWSEATSDSSRRDLLADMSWVQRAVLGLAGEHE